LYVHQWAQRAVRELTAIAQGESSPWNLPATTTGEERILGQKSDSFERGGTIVIIAREHSTASVLDDACRSVGYQTVVLRDPKAATISDAMAVVWDTSAADATDPSRVTDLQRRFADAKILAIWGFPRADEIARAQTAGVTAVVSKPFLLADLIWQIDQLAGDFVGDQTGSSQVSSRSARKISRRHSGSWIGQPHTRMPGTSANIGKP
jgi:DNA-binding NtrC family response regulator